MNTKLLKKICNKIDEGRPLWAMFWANEYFEREHPLRKALLMKAESLAGSQAGTLGEKARAGATISELTPVERTTLKAYSKIPTIARREPRVVLTGLLQHRSKSQRRGLSGREVVKYRTLRRPKRATFSVAM